MSLHPPRDTQCPPTAFGMTGPLTPGHPWKTPWRPSQLCSSQALSLTPSTPSFSFDLGVSQTQHYIIRWAGSSVIMMATLCIIGYSGVTLAPTYQMPVCLETLLNILQIMMQSCLLYSPQVLIRRAVPVNFLCRNHWISGASQWMGHLIKYEYLFIAKLYLHYRNYIMNSIKTKNNLRRDKNKHN